MKVKLVASLCLLLGLNSAFAIENAAVEDTTPPPAEGPLKANQIPPMDLSAKNKTAPVNPSPAGQPPAPSSAASTNPPATPAPPQQIIMGQ